MMVIQQIGMNLTGHVFNFLLKITTSEVIFQWKALNGHPKVSQGRFGESINPVSHCKSQGEGRSTGGGGWNNVSFQLLFLSVKITYN